jgi:hypothetical protein
MQTPNEQTQAPDNGAAQSEAPAKRKNAEKTSAGQKKSAEHKHHRRHGKGEGRHGEAKPLPQGSLQSAMRDAAGDWKAFRDEQTALGRSQKSFWLTEEEAWRVRNYIRKMREKAEKHQKLLAEQARGKAERQAQALAKTLTESMTGAEGVQSQADETPETAE